ncbi:cytochrome c oxidase subunit 3 [Inmirania thermothiophila]|uniref:Nitric oxide reductase NorE protein n=1 Tax=Inmirania thermothiophila TaxID=1750597 RepID=A0A3N1XS59_9GAMM|nr:cytochrome c oxidase subunit 3 [Inmirania thermothiophila]ROR29489.1 nitric oxide reductase NorE protein [Inmirania thermothiophila]
MHGCAIAGRRLCPGEVRRDGLPGDLAIWFFIFAELLAFAAFFLAYAWTRRSAPELFDAGQAVLDRRAALANTLALVAASLVVARAVAEAAAGQGRRAAGLLWAGFGLGALFLLVKGYEYAHLAALGHGLEGELFFTFYYLLTGFHALHVVLGMVILAWMAVRAGRGAYDLEQHGLESGASYWHMVDLVWLVLFPLVYVLH